MGVLLRTSQAVALGALVAGALAAPAPARTWHVRDAASLAVAQERSRPGDRILVQPAPQAIDGGIRLKARQQLVGAGGRLTNSDPHRLDGDVVRLADGVTVRGVTIVGARRGGIYGIDVARATITGNDVSGHNRDCVRGFFIPPFSIPTLVPLVAVPISAGLDNGWAGIMVDVTHGTAKLGIRGNRVHDSACGDGIDVRASGDARVRATIAGNDVRELRQGPGLESVLALGLQARERSRLVARVEDNHQSGLGSLAADSEGIFVNPVGPSSMRVTVARNVYTHVRGRGGFSANGLEFVAMGNGSRALVDVRDSTFSGTPGDVLEQLALGTDARLRMRLDGVVARDSSGSGDTIVIPGNNGDCLVAASGGAGNTIDLALRHTVLTGCVNNGLTFGSGVANGSGPGDALLLDVADSTIAHNRDGNLRVGNLAALRRLRLSVVRTDLSGSGGAGSTPANLAVENLGSTADAAIAVHDSCLAGGPLAALAVGYDVDARANWWGGGQPRAVAVGGVLDTRDALLAAPAACR